MSRSPRTRPDRVIPAPAPGAGLASLCVVLAACSSAPEQDDQSLPDPLAAGWHGKPVCEALHDDVRMRILRCTFPPGVGHERHYHDPHFGYVIRGGKMRLVEGGETRVVDIPDGIMWQRDERFEHAALNVGDNESQYLIIEIHDQGGH